LIVGVVSKARGEGFGYELERGETKYLERWFADMERNLKKPALGVYARVGGMRNIIRAGNAVGR
jgi:hypothetical protein